MQLRCSIYLPWLGCIEGQWKVHRSPWKIKVLKKKMMLYCFATLPHPLTHPAQERERWRWHRRMQEEKRNKGNEWHSWGVDGYKHHWILVRLPWPLENYNQDPFLNSCFLYNRDGKKAQAWNKKGIFRYLIPVKGTKSQLSHLLVVCSRQVSQENVKCLAYNNVQ